MNKPVYSTDSKSQSNIKNYAKSAKKKSFVAGVGKTHVRIEKKGRGGKVVTILYNLAMTLEEAQTLRKKLQSHYACGATLKNSQIELSGDFQDSVLQFIKNSSEK